MSESPPAPRAMEFIVGLVVGLIGLGLLYIVTLLSYASIQQQKAPETTFWIITAIFTVVGVFCTLLAYRLILNRGARAGGGLLSPTGWRTLGNFFILLAVALSIAVVWQRQWGQLAAPIFGLALGSGCYFAAKTREKRDVPK